jgi:lipoate-protein ligase A
MHVAQHRLIIDPPAPGPWNMAVDEALLLDAAAGGAATLRFYQWSEPTLSLGYFQRYEDRCQHAASRDCAVVRRQTGGGAILHDRELTYSLTLPATHRLAKQGLQLYALVHDAVIAELASTLNLLAQRLGAREYPQPNQPSRDEPFLCFERRTSGDVLLVADRRSSQPEHPQRSVTADPKILGSAQRRHHGAILQHGSLLLARSPAAPDLPGIGDIAGVEIPVAELSTGLSARLAQALQVEWTMSRLPPRLESIARDVANHKYGAAAWTKRR